MLTVSKKIKDAIKQKHKKLFPPVIFLAFYNSHF